MYWFTFLSAIASVLSLILQLKDVFPAHRDTRKKLSILVLGCFIGSIFGVLQKVDFTISMSYNPLALLILIILIAVLLFLLVTAAIGIFSKEPKRRGEAKELLFVGFIAAILFVFPFGGMALHGLWTSSSMNDLTDAELVKMSNMCFENKNLERSLEFLERLNRRLTEDDPRKEMLQKRINKIKKDLYQLDFEKTKGDDFDLLKQ